MKLLKRFTILLIVLITIFFFNTSCFAATDQFRTFMTWDYENNPYHENVNNAVSHGVWTFQKLGYINAIGTNNYTNTNDKNYLLNEWIRISGNNYGFYIYAHGNSSGFTLENGNSSKFVSSSDISGNWHLVFLDSCSCLATDTFGRAFKTLGYSNRATLGWYMDIAHVASEEWWTHFYPVVGTTNIRSACLTAADQSQNKTPIRMYGDTSWYGWAW